MIEYLFTTLSTAMSGDFSVALAGAFGWGVLSILLSPCHLSSIPLVVGYLGNRDELNSRHAYGLATVFALGILVTIALVGVATAARGRMLGDVGVWGNVFVAGLFFVIGLYLMDLIPLNMAGFAPARWRTGGGMGAFALGLLFGIGLGPCTFAFLAPVLGVVFRVSATSSVEAVLLLLAFAIGHCAVIAGAGGSVHRVQRYLNWSDRSRVALYVKRGAGACVFLAGGYFLYTVW